jgi:hypothetical protein
MLKNLTKLARGIAYAEHIVKTQKTLRQTAATFDTHHSSVYVAIENIKDEKPLLYERVHEIYESHRHHQEFRKDS